MVNFRDSYFKIDWDLSQKRLKGTFWGKQYDTGRGFTVTVINGGQVLTATTEVLRLKWEKPDNTSGYVQATIINGKFIIENIDQMFTVQGSVRADFELSVGGEFVASITFYVNVEKAVAVGAIESSSDFTALQTALSDVDVVKSQLAEMAKHISPTGTSDDTAYLQSVLNAHENVVLRAGVYNINAVTNINVPENRTIFFEKGAILQAIATSLSTYTILNINAENITIHNPVIVGERASHIGTTGEHGHGIVISSLAKNIKIHNPQIKDCWGDGFVVYGGEDIRVDNLISDNNRRQGLTITNIKRGYFMNPVCSNTNGTSPQAGIDIEPNVNTDVIQDLFIVNPVTLNNAGSGIIVSLARLNGANGKVGITIENHRDDGSYTGFYVGSLLGSTSYIVDGAIRNNNPMYRESKTAGIMVRNYSALNTPTFQFSRPVIINPNVLNLASPRAGSGIVLVREVSDTSTDVMGNIIIDEPTIIDNRPVPQMKRGIYCADDKEINFAEVTINNPKKIYGVTSPNTVEVRGGCTVRDSSFTTKLNSILGTNTIYSAAIAKVTNDGALQITPFTLNRQKFFDSPITFSNMTSFGIRVTPLGTQKILPLSQVAGKYIETTQIGASITLRQISDSVYIIENIVGTWIVQP